MKYMFADLEAYSLKYYNIHKRVDAYVIGAKTLEGDEFIWDVDMDSWFQQLIDKKESLTIFFHNLSGYDGQFLLPFMLDKYGMKNVTYFIDDKKKVFQITLTQRFRDYNDLNYRGKAKRKKFTITFRDSWKLWPMPLKVLGKQVGMDKLDYGEYDILDEFPTKESYAEHNNGKSLEYFERDIEILRQFALQTRHLMPLEDYKMTLASTAMNKWAKTNVPLSKELHWSTKNKIVKEILENGLPKMKEQWESDYETWRIVKKAYKGGITYVKPEHQLKELKDVHSYDINSMYPAIMLNECMPYGKPVTEEHKADDTYTYKIFKVNIEYAKTYKMPFIPRPIKEEKKNVVKTIKGLEKSEIYQGIENQYPDTLTDCEVYMNNYTYELFKDTYEGVWDVEFQVAYRETYGAFYSYLTHYREIKENSEGAERQLSKLFSNSLYGKFGQDIQDLSTQILKYDDVKHHITKTEKTTYLDGKQVIVNDGYVYVLENKGLKRNISFIAMAEAISSKARIKLVKAINDNWESFVYCDTDSIHLLEEAKGLTLHESNYGDWAFEGKWDRAVYRRAKHYYHINDNGDYELKGGGFQVGNFNPDNLPMETYLQPEFIVENGKTNSYIVDGGVIITHGDYKFSMPLWYKNEEEK